MNNVNIANNHLKFVTRAVLRNNWLADNKLDRLLFNFNLSRESINNYQLIHLKKTVKIAVKTIPRYKDIQFNQNHNLTITAILNKFPVIEKKDLLQYKNQFYPAKKNKKPWCLSGKTSGTTGSPLETFRSYSSVLYENAFIRRLWKLYGNFNKWEKRATMRGDVIVPIHITKPPFWFYNPYENQLLISSRHLCSETFQTIYNKLKKFSPKLLEAYPSTAYELSLLLQKHNKFLKIPYVFTGSEILYLHQRELIKKRLCCTVLDFYGMAERVAFAHECDHGNYHINSDYSYVEILDENNQPTTGFGNIVGTTFHNYTMPLIRYKLSDITKWKQGQCKCSCIFPMIEPIQGKFEDIIFGGHNTVISPSVLTFAFKGLKGIKRSQVAQINKGFWEIRIIPYESFNNDSQNMLVENIHKLVDPWVDIRIRIVDAIPKTISGKYRWVINEWKNPNAS